MSGSNCLQCNHPAMGEREEPLNVERLADAFHLVDERHPGIFNDIAIDETVERPIAGLVALAYARLSVNEGIREV